MCTSQRRAMKNSRAKMTKRKDKTITPKVTRIMKLVDRRKRKRIRAVPRRDGDGEKVVGKGASYTIERMRVR
jgi:hypothetical protein